MAGNSGAVEPVIGHLKDDHGMGRNPQPLVHRIGDATNAILAAAG